MSPEHPQPQPERAPKPLTPELAMRLVFLEAGLVSLVFTLFIVGLTMGERAPLVYPAAFVPYLLGMARRSRILRQAGRPAGFGPGRGHAPLNRREWHFVAAAARHQYLGEAGYWGARIALIGPLAVAWVLTLG
jgi:hypothetical protein